MAAIPRSRRKDGPDCMDRPSFPSPKECVLPLPQALLKGLSLLVLTLVVVGCTSGGGSLSDVERREIDAVLDTFLEGVRSGEPSLMADALAEEVALGVSADD